MKVLQPLWNQSSPRTNNCLAYSSHFYSGLGPNERALRLNVECFFDTTKQSMTWIYIGLQTLLKTYVLVMGDKMAAGAFGRATNYGTATLMFVLV